MKRVIALAIGIAVIGSVSYAQTNQVLSRNAVGYIKVTAFTNASANGLTMVRMPFFSLPATNMTGVLGGALVGAASGGLADQIQKWNPTSQTYVTYFKHTSGQWRKVGDIVETTDTIVPGDTFWIRNRRLTNQVVTLMGEVPDTITAPTFTTNLLPGLNFVSYAYPIDIAITNLGLYSNAVKAASGGLADQIQTWDPIAQGYVTFFAHNGVGSNWRKVGEIVNTTNVIGVGEGMWYRRRGSATTNWVQVKPYTWP